MSEQTSTDCSTEEGVTVGVIDGIIAMARVLLERDLSGPAVTAALKDMRTDPDLGRAFGMVPDSVYLSACEGRRRFREAVRELRAKTGNVERYFVNDDDDGHWYLVPASKRAAWLRWLALDPTDERAWDPPEFAKRIDGPHRLTFTDPVESRVVHAAAQKGTP